jgi:hypothetical protein
MGGPGSGRKPSGHTASRQNGRIEGKKGITHRNVLKSGKWAKFKPVSKLKTRR